MDRDQQDKILAFHERSESVPKECQSECHMILDKWHSGLYNYVVVNMRLLSASYNKPKSLLFFLYERAGFCRLFYYIVIYLLC